MSTQRGRQVVLPLQALPPILSEYPELANQLRLRHAYIQRLEQGERLSTREIVVHNLTTLKDSYEALFVAYPLLLQQFETADCYIRGLLHRCSHEGVCSRR